MLNVMAQYLPRVLAATDDIVLPELFDAQEGSDDDESCCSQLERFQRQSGW